MSVRRSRSNTLPNVIRYRAITISRLSSLRKRILLLAASALALSGIGGAGIEVVLPDAHTGLAAAHIASAAAQIPSDLSHHENQTGSGPAGSGLHMDHCGHAHAVAPADTRSAMAIPVSGTLRIAGELNLLRSIAGPPRLRPPIA